MEACRKDAAHSEEGFDLAGEGFRSDRGTGEVNLDSTSIESAPPPLTDRMSPGQTVNKADERRCLDWSKGGLDANTHAGTAKRRRLWNLEPSGKTV